MFAAMTSLAETMGPAGSGASHPFALPMRAVYAALGDGFYTKLPPERVTDDPVLIHASADAARLIGLSPTLFRHPSFPAIFSGAEPLPGFEPLAMVYSGHQFGQWAGQLGDGRALTIGQVEGPAGVIDIQLKGAGRTPYSRFGDGRAVLRSSIREYLCSEAMAALGVPTTRALCVIGTRRPVRRETIEPGAVVTRLMRSNIRFGHFEHFHHRGDMSRVRRLADFVIETCHPQLVGQPNRHALWFRMVVERTADLMARWQAIGFCHGVMNTDNMSILGDTIDYGPFGFLDAFDPQHICNHSDQWGRYAYDQQPAIGLWNLQALATALQSLMPWEELEASLKTYVRRFSQSYGRLMRAKLGLADDFEAGDEDLAGDLLALMKRSGADYTLSFRLLSSSFDNPGRARWTALFDEATRAQAFAWLDRWQARVGDDPERLRALDRVNPKFVLRNWVAETAIRAVEDHGDVATLDRIFRLVTQPFDAHGEADEPFALGPPDSMRHLEVSCSS